MGWDPDELERYRSALEAATSRSSLRAVAAAVGMSPTGLTQFIDGTEPYGKTLLKVRRWYVRHVGWESEKAEQIAEQLRDIIGPLPHPDTGVANMLDAVDRSYRHAGLTPPGWVGRVRRFIEGGATGAHLQPEVR